MGLNSDINLSIYSLCMEGVMALANLHICTCSTEPSMCHTAISTKTKCFGSFYLFFALNRAELNFLKRQRDDNHRDIHEGCYMWTELL